MKGKEMESESEEGILTETRAVFWDPDSEQFL